MSSFLTHTLARLGPYLVSLAPQVGVGLSVYLVVLNLSLGFLSWPVSNTLAVLVSLALVVTAVRRLESAPAVRLNWSEFLYLVLGSGLVGAVCLSWYWEVVPHDFWLDFPQQALLAQNGLPVTHPFFENLPLGGQYGRNLLVAGLARLFRMDVMTVAILCNVAFQMLGFWQIYLVFREHSQRTAVYATLLCFLGLGVGGWCGLLDHFFHHAALSHFLLFVAWYQVQRRSWLAMAPLLALGITFPLYLCLLIPAWLVTTKPSKPMGLALALLLILVPLQGGPLRQLLSKSGAKSELRASQEQSFSVKFPKQHLFSICLQPWPYWRTSLGLSSLPGFPTPPDYQPREYASVFSLKVLSLHWIPLWLAPITLLLGTLESRRWWCFGALAYLVPALVDFGPVYEAEYYRWELAAALGFACSLAVCLGQRSRWWSLLILLCCWPGFYRLASTDWSLRWPWQSVWIEHHAQALRLRNGEADVARVLRKISGPRDIIWRDSMPAVDDNKSMDGDAAVVGLSRRRMTGKAFPVGGDFIGRPPFRPSQSARAFWTLADPAAPITTGVRWLVANSERDFSAFAVQRFRSQDVTLWELPHLAVHDVAEHPGHGVVPESLEMRPGEVRLDASWCPKFAGVLSMEWVRDDAAQEGEWRSQTIYQSRHDGLILSAPVLAGDYRLEVSTGQSIPVRVLPTSDLSKIRFLGYQASEAGTMVQLRNDSDGELRLHDVLFSLSPVGGGAALASALHEIFVISPGGEVRFALSPSAQPLPPEAILKIQSVEESGTLLLKR